MFKTDFQDMQYPYFGFELSTDALQETVRISGMDRSCQSSDFSVFFLKIN